MSVQSADLRRSEREGEGCADSRHSKRTTGSTSCENQRTQIVLDTRYARRISFQRNIRGGVLKMADQWLFQSETYDNCNCQINCGCQFNLPTTNGYCQSAYIGHIVEGHFNNTRRSWG